MDLPDKSLYLMFYLLSCHLKKIGQNSWCTLRRKNVARQPMALQTKMVHYIEAHVILYQLLIRIYVVGRRESGLFHNSL